MQASASGATAFQGYATGGELEAELKAALVAGGVEAKAAEGRCDKVSSWCSNQSPFYAESGGQVGDAGVITGPDGLRIAVRDTQKKLGLFVHTGVLEAGHPRPGQAVVATVDGERRSAIEAHHSATHLLHEALRRRLGTHVAQKGSLNAPDRLRFDVSHNKPMEPAELAAVEAEVNARIRENAAVTTRLMTPEAAVAEGAMALFGEKYGDEVRVVSMGRDKDRAFSVELCGGTHVRRTGDIGLFRIVSEGGVAAGIRRVEAVTGAAALALVDEAMGHLREAAAVLKVNPAELPARITSLVEERRKLERDLAELRKKLATGGAAAAVEQIGGLRVALREMGDTPAKDLRGIAEAILKGGTADVVALASNEGGKASIVVGVAGDGADAVPLARAAAAAVGGKGGGGKPNMAQAGGPDGDKLADALAAVRLALAG